VDEQLTLAVGETRRVPLPGLAQSGYRWSATVESGADVVAVKTEFESSQPAQAVPGRPFAGEVVAITGRAPGNATVRLAQARSWEETGAIAERRLAVTVVDRAS
jgi:predicted secreted protein